MAKVKTKAIAKNIPKCSICEKDVSYCNNCEKEIKINDPIYCDPAIGNHYCSDCGLKKQN